VEPNQIAAPRVTPAMTRRTSIILAVVALALVVALAGSASGVVHAAKATRNVSADPDGDLAFTKKRLTAPRGRITLKMKNPSSSGLPHGIAIKKKKGAEVDPGGTSTVTIRLTPGTYTYYCPVAGHRAAGMKGRLTVTKN
jgi:uncharacterized cupredoxin-like copper-binding protein